MIGEFSYNKYIIKFINIKILLYHAVIEDFSPHFLSHSREKPAAFIMMCILR